MKLAVLTAMRAMRRGSIVLMITVGPVLAAPADKSEVPPGSCEAPVSRNFPVASPVEVGMSPEQLLRLNEALEKDEYEVRGLLILRDCKLVFERYKDGVGRDYNHSLYSATKSISATLIGALLYRGKLKSVDEPLSNLLPKARWFSQESWKNKAERITLKNVMQMGSGLAYKHDPLHNPIYALTADRLRVALSPDFAAEPGTKFNYSDGDASVTGAVVAAIANENLYRFARHALFDQLQMYNHDWWFIDGVGRYPGGWGLRLRPMDMLKVGQLYIQRGVWNSQRLFDVDFPELAWSHGPSNVYGLHWWIGNSPEAAGTPFFYANGLKGQRIYVFPTLRLVAALAASLSDSEVRKVHALVVGGLVGAANEPPGPDSEALTALIAKQRTGFRGKIHVLQSDQDRPRSP